MPLVAETRQRNQPSITHAGQGGGVANHLNAPSQKINEGLAGTAIGHVFQLDASRFGEDFALQLRNGAIAGGTEAQFAWPLFGQGH